MGDCGNKSSILYGMFFEHSHSDGEEVFLGVFDDIDLAINSYISNKNNICASNNLVYTASKSESLENSYTVYEHSPSIENFSPSVEGYIDFRKLSINEIVDLSMI